MRQETAKMAKIAGSSDSEQKQEQEQEQQLRSIVD